ncbi:MAG TPA: hypothetical protein VFT84_07995 [Gemmatimonadales bacterium]|nr:hypothetical protein [Gemmatimonadales bacterium]
MSRPLALLLLALLPCMLAAQSPDSLRTARVTYVTGSSAYVDAGLRQGLREGAAVELLRGGAVAATLRVSFVSGRQAACTLEGVTAKVAVGDTVRYVAAEEPSVAVAKGAAAAPQPARGRGGRLRGRVGARYLSVRQGEGSLSRYSQPALDLRVDGTDLGGTGVGVQVDVRARRVTGSHADGTREESGQTRVYQGALSWRGRGMPLRISAGRQFAPGGASVSLFDGVFAEVGGRRWAAGAFAGNEPDPADLGFSSAVRDYGAYAELRPGAAGATRGFLRTGVVGSYQEGAANREYVFLHGGVSGRRFSTLISQEVDYYRSWKRDTSESALSPTSTFASVSLQPVDAVTLTAGFDNRRDVRLYRDMVTPETEFDDSFRHGGWAGVSLFLAGRYRLGFDARSSSGGSAGTAKVYTGSAAVTRLTRYAGEVRVRSSRYDGPRLSGWIHSLTLGLEPAPWAHVEGTGGVRQERNPLENPSELHVSWVTADLDLSVGRAWYLLLSVSRERGAFESSDQVYGGVSYRF